MIRREIDSPYAWFRLAVSVLLSAVGGAGMWSVVVALPAVQTEFGLDRGAASLPFTLTMIGFGAGGVFMGRLADRRGLVPTLMIGAASIGGGFILVSLSRGLLSFAAAYLFIGTFGMAATFVPVLASISFWFERRRGIAVALCTCGNSLAGTVWPILIEPIIHAYGWRIAHLVVGVVCLVTIPPLALLLGGRPPVLALGGPAPIAASRGIALPPAVLQTLLMIAGLACCVAMSMPQVHIVAYCSDLGYGAGRGAQMLSLMLGLAIVSRIASGFLADWLGGVPTLLISSLAQMVALMLYLMMDGLTSLYVISALFGLFQGGLIPSYPIIVRESFPANEAGRRVGLVLMMTLGGMALGGWMSGAVYDLTGSYRAAFANGIAWNALNFLIALFLLFRSPLIAPRRATAPHAGSAAE